jgi:hypothetical protein
MRLSGKGRHYVFRHYWLSQLCSFRSFSGSNFFAIFLGDEGNIFNFEHLQTFHDDSVPILLSNLFLVELVEPYSALWLQRSHENHIYRIRPLYLSVSVPPLLPGTLGKEIMCYTDTYLESINVVPVQGDLSHSSVFIIFCDNQSSGVDLFTFPSKVWVW